MSSCCWYWLAMRSVSRNFEVTYGGLLLHLLDCDDIFQVIILYNFGSHSLSNPLNLVVNSPCPLPYPALPTPVLPDPALLFMELLGSPCLHHDLAILFHLKPKLLQLCPKVIVIHERLLETPSN